MANIAIIPARGGSKRIPGKNIKEFLGKPIIAYSIQTAFESGLFDRVIVSTDSEEIAEISLKYGAEVPFMRSAKNSDDFSTTADVLIEVLEELKLRIEKFCCIYPTAPLLRTAKLIEAYHLLIENDFDTVFPVTAFSYPIWRSLNMNKDGKVRMNWPENLSKRSQDLPNAFHDAGQFYWARTNCFLKNRELWTENTGSILLKEEEVQDIDTLSDWTIAELKYKILADESV